MYKYLFIFISDIFKQKIVYTLAIYIESIQLIKKINLSIKNELDNIKLKKNVKYNILKFIGSIKHLCINNVDILIRLPYKIFNTFHKFIPNLVLNIFSNKYKNIIRLDKEVAHYLNNAYKKYKMDIIVMLIKKINFNSILCIFNYLDKYLEEIEFRSLFNSIYNIKNAKFYYKYSINNADKYIKIYI
jgi:hypothetical protein